MATIMDYDEMARRLAELPPDDPDMMEAIYMDYIDKGYIIYDGKKNKSVCTRCGHEWDLYPGEYSRMHGLAETCPYCESPCMLLAAGRGRKCFTEYIRLLNFVEHEGTLWGFLNYIIADFTPAGRPSLFYSLDDIYIIDKERQERWHLRWSYHKRCYERFNNMKVPAAPTAPYTWDSKWKDFVYTEGLEEMIARSDCRYLLGAADLIRNAGIDIPSYLGTMMKYHSVELLAKAGFRDIAEWKIHGNGCKCINWRAHSLEKILKLPKRDVKRLRPWNPSCRELDAFQQMSEQDRRDVDLPILRDMLTWDRYDVATKTYRNVYKEEVERYMPFDKWLRWAKTQEHYRKSKSPNLLRDYRDYIGTATMLGMDIHKKSVLRPKDLKQAHDDVNKRIKTANDSIIDAAIEANARSTGFTYGQLMIIPAKCQEDLNKESAKLCHCVKTYGDKLARGSCFIFFVRNINAPDEPFYTLETRPSGEFVQCRGKQNCSMTNDVKLFTDAFVKKLKAEIKKERGTICQTA